MGIYIQPVTERRAPFQKGPPPMIVYFSATGNSKYVAERLARSPKDETVSIPDLLDAGDLDLELTQGESLGLVTPTYFWGLPSVVTEFLDKVSVSGAGYTFLVATYGSTTGAVGGIVKRALADKGVALSARFEVKMPDTWTPIFDLSDEHAVARLNAEAERQIAGAIQLVGRKQEGDFIRHKTPAPTGCAASVLYDKARTTNHLSVDDACIGCGVCAKRCPTHAIEMRDGYPVWVKDRCAMCLGCLHHCPKFSIQYGPNTRAHGQYVNPHERS